ncbi:MAG: hypothetical protein M3680_03290 [Myxococcota bacterium]|nr:hypothetical protein [Myxococcota bacterium]
MIVDELGLRTYVVWIPMLDRDEGSEVPAVSRTLRVTPQYFDGEKRVGAAIARSLSLTEPVWDAFLFYPPGATWGAEIAPPELAVAQVAGVVVGTPGTLPAVADQARLPSELVGTAAVIGAQSDIKRILQVVASGFAARHPRVAPP